MKDFLLDFDGVPKLKLTRDEIEVAGIEIILVLNEKQDS
jgi:hypothetical protein